MRNNLENIDSPGLGVSIWRDLPFEIRPQTLLKCLTKQPVCEVTQSHLRRLLDYPNVCLHLSHLLHHEGILQMMCFGLGTAVLAPCALRWDCVLGRTTMEGSL